MSPGLGVSYGCLVQAFCRKTGSVRSGKLDSLVETGFLDGTTGSVRFLMGPRGSALAGME